MIDVNAAEAMLHWIRWQNMVDLPKKYNLSQIKAAQKAYINAKRLAKVRTNPANINQMQVEERKSWRLTAKA